MNSRQRRHRLDSLVGPDISVWQPGIPMPEPEFIPPLAAVRAVALERTPVGKRRIMNTSQVLKVVGIVLVCTGIHFGLGALLPLIVFGCGLGFIFLP